MRPDYNSLPEDVKKYQYAEGYIVIAVHSHIRQANGSILVNEKWEPHKNTERIGTVVNPPRRLGKAIWGQRDPSFPPTRDMVTFDDGRQALIDRAPDYFRMDEVEGFDMQAGDGIVFDPAAIMPNANTKTQTVDLHPNYMETLEDGTMIYRIEPKSAFLYWSGEFGLDRIRMCPGYVLAEGVSIVENKRMSVWKDEDGKRHIADLSDMKDTDHAFRIIAIGGGIGEESKECKPGEVVVTQKNCDLLYEFYGHELYIFQENWIVAKADVVGGAIDNPSPLGNWIMLRPIMKRSAIIEYAYDLGIAEVEGVGSNVEGLSKGDMVIPFHIQPHRTVYDRSTDSYIRKQKGNIKRGGEWVRVAGKSFCKAGVIMAKLEEL